MTAFFDWLFAFLARAFQVPELAAILPALAAGMALAYVLTLPLPAETSLKAAKQYGRVLVFATVMLVSLALSPTPRTAAWAFTVALLAPLFHEWLFAIVYHRWPWLQPKSLRPEACEVREP